MKNVIKKIISLMCLGAAVSFPVFAFTPPTQAPPGGNVVAPLNTSNVGQSKQGGLILNTGGADIGLIVQGGRVLIGTTNPGAAGGEAVTIAGMSTGEGLAAGIGPRLSIRSLSGSTIGPRIRLAHDGSGEAGARNWAVKSAGSADAESGSVGSFAIVDATVNGGGTRFVIDAQGRVGVGTISPTQKLQVVGVVQADSFCLNSDSTKCAAVSPYGSQETKSFPSTVGSQTTCSVGYVMVGVKKVSSTNFEIVCQRISQ